MDKDGAEKRVLEEDILPAFPKGTRVIVNWDFEGQLFHGVVVNWNGGSKYDVWYDGESKHWSTSGAEMELSNKPLSKSCHSAVRKVVESSRVVDVGSGGSGGSGGSHATPNVANQRRQQQKTTNLQQPRRRQQQQIVKASPTSTSKTKVKSIGTKNKKRKSISSSSTSTSNKDWCSGMRVSVYWDGEKTSYNGILYGKRRIGKDGQKSWLIKYEDGDSAVEQESSLKLCKAKSEKSAKKVKKTNFIEYKNVKN
jgi:hypothetical protein